MNERQRRIEAIRRVKQGESVRSVCQALDRSRTWFYKWATVFAIEGLAGLVDHRQGNEGQPATPPWLQELIVDIRDRLVREAHQGDSWVGIGARQVARELEGLQVKPVPHWMTVHRLLKKAGRIPAAQESQPVGYCPRPRADQVNAVQQIDIWPRVLAGGQKLYFFHLIDVASWYPFGLVEADKSTDTALAFLLAAWKRLGLPAIAQLDNEMSFTGGRWAHRLGRVVRLCLALGVAVWFIPFYTPQRNGFVESFHSQCQHFFWSRHTFASLAEVRAKYPAFLEAFPQTHHLPAIAHQTPAQVRAQFGDHLRGVPADFCLARPKQLPIVTGTIFCVRVADRYGNVNVLNHQLNLGESYARHYLVAEISTRDQEMTLYHQPDENAERQPIAVFPFPLPEAVVDFDPTFSYLLVDG